MNVLSVVKNPIINMQILSQTDNTRYVSNFFGTSWSNPDFTFNPNSGYKIYSPENINLEIELLYSQNLIYRNYMRYNNNINVILHNLPIW